MTLQSMAITEIGQSSSKSCFRPRWRVKVIIAMCVVLVCIGFLGAYFLWSGVGTGPRRTEPDDPLEPPKPSASKMHVFRRGAVCTDAERCSEVGRDILARNGSAVDAAIAAMFCNGLLNIQSCGVGGGFQMTVFIKKENQAYSLIARETAPGAATADMFQHDPNQARKGPLAVAIPGEVRGLWAAHKRWGFLPWAQLVAPAVNICREGYTASFVLMNAINNNLYLKHDSNIRKQFFIDDKPVKAGTTVKGSDNLCNTLEQIMIKGGDELYNGTLAQMFADDLMDAGSIITAEDLAGYQPEISEPIAVPLSGGDILYTPPPPGSGVLVGYILNILSGFDFTPDSINTSEDKILTYHRIIEAFKFAYAKRTLLGDRHFLKLDDLLKNLTSPAYAVSIRRRINDSRTSNSTDYYGAEYVVQKEDTGTAHISILGTNGDAVSVTSSVNYYFGAGFTGLRTGIILNNVMDDFSTAGFTNYFNLPPSPSNFIAPGKRPLSSMSPSIIVDRYGNAKLVIGASGGSKIISSVALTAIRKLWLGQNVKAATDEPRIHHQLRPMYVEYEFGVTKDITEGLKAKGHDMVRSPPASVTCTLFKNGTGIFGNSDWRKGGEVKGIGPILEMPSWAAQVASPPAGSPVFR